MGDDISVRVALRIRPQIAREKIDMCRVCTSVSAGEPQVWLGSDKAFTYDFVFDINSAQAHIYETCVQSLVEGCFEGYNATVLAYGQTGSGKTYTMGTGFDVNITSDEELGIIPRAVTHIFQGMEQRIQKNKEQGEPPPEFKVNAQFMELYNEEIIDLFDTTRDPFLKGRKSHIKIHEDPAGGIYALGVVTTPVTSQEETLRCLKLGALSRTTASTQMNAMSSRSHAIFTLHIIQQRIIQNTEGEGNEGLSEFETLSAKFHFVDLAGSERLKRTGATGERAKEGISINCGLLALGNVISALGDKCKKGSHVPYRDSKLTRLLQDSLGGNSRTLMIACVSPSDRDFMETLNTLKYANRARNIKNKVSINQDKTSKTIQVLRNEIQQLQLELLEYRQGKRIVDTDGVESVNDMFHENTMLQTENNNLRMRIKAMQETIDRLTARNVKFLAEREKDLRIQNSDNTSDEMSSLVEGYLKEIEELRAKLLESEATCQILRRSSARSASHISLSPSQTLLNPMELRISPEGRSSTTVIDQAKKEIERLKNEQRSKSRVSESENAILEEQSKKDSDKEDGSSNDEEELNIEDDDDDSSDIDSDGKESNYTEDLAELTTEISVKQRLVEELEASHRRLQVLRMQYEEKLLMLENKIRATQIERDHVLASLGNIETNSEEKSKKVRDEYEKKINDLQKELKKLQAAKKEHSRLQRSQMQSEKQLKGLQLDLAEMKRNKVKLMNKMKEEAQKNKESEARRNREIVQLKKESRQRENVIKTLEAEKKLKEAVLRRKQEEVQFLRKVSKPMSARVAGRIGKYHHGDLPFTEAMKKKLTFSPKAAKHKWQNLEKNISSLVSKKQTVCNIEKDMEHWIKKREKLGQKLERFIIKKNDAIANKKDEITIKDLEDQIENMHANIDYFQENISECQANIMQMEESKVELPDLTSLLTTCHIDEVKYLMDHLLNLTISQCLLVTQKETTAKEMQLKIIQAEQNSTMQQQLLQHMLEQSPDLEIPHFMTNGDSDVSDDMNSEYSGSLSPAESTLQDNMVLASGNGISDVTTRNKNKARRKTATPADLLYAGSNPEEVVPILLPIACIDEEPQQDNEQPSKDSDQMIMPPPRSGLRPNSQIPRPSSAPSFTALPTRKKPDASPIFGRKNNIAVNSGDPGNKPMPPQNVIDITPDITPPGSPPVRRKERDRDENVFSRLTVSSHSDTSLNVSSGIINAFTGKHNTSKASPLYCTHVAEGHTKAVLSVAATEDKLFSSSKDRTVKVWDLNRGQEIQSLGGHPNNVIVVRYSDYNKLAFSVSMSYIKVWDIRENPVKCVKTLSSSGLSTAGPVILGTPSRTLQMPPGETQINDIALNRYGTVLFSAAGNSVRVWDLRKYHSIGKLSGGHQAAVMCLAVEELSGDSNVIVTGSKDHYIKVFEVLEGAGGVHTPKYNLEPPHYDGIQSLALMGNYLFSGSRDFCVKKWDLSDHQLKQSVNQAHRDWICALSFIPGRNCILSGCRAGFLKLWNIDTCILLGEIRAHGSPINAITTNSNCVFTGANESSIKIWRVSPLRVRALRQHFM